MNTSTKVFFNVLLLTFMLGLAGCQKNETAEKAEQKTSQAGEQAAAQMESAKEKAGEAVGKAGQYADDSVITAKVKTDFLSDPLVRDSKIEVTTTNGVVTLSGTVDSQQIIDRSKEIAQSVEGVKSVESKLVVKGKE